MDAPLFGCAANADFRKHGRATFWLRRKCGLKSPPRLRYPAAHDTHHQRDRASGRAATEAGRTTKAATELLALYDWLTEAGAIPHAAPDAVAA